MPEPAAEVRAVARGPCELADALRAEAAAGARGTGRVTVLYSGGLDSSLVAFLLKPLVSVRLLVIGTEGSKDPGAARAGARLLDLPLIEARVDRTDVDRWTDRFRFEVDGLREPLRSVQVAFGIAISHAPDREVAVGQGADELFYGYAHFRGLSEADARARGIADWRALEEQEWPRANRVAHALGHELFSPFMVPAIVQLARTYPPPSGDQAPKAVLRSVARLLGLPEPLVDARKRAFQYGSGVQRLMARRPSLPSGSSGESGTD